jgi:4'-phosphopantetheinyl transferase
MRTTQPPWNTPPIHLELTIDDVHIWQAHLEIPVSLVSQFQQVLVPEERARAQRFYSEKDRHRWIVARGLLRILLSRYTDTDPLLIRFSTNAYGKPFLAFPDTPVPLQFNLSHSRDLVVYAFALQRHLGVDVEYMRPDLAYDEIATHSFSTYEQTVLRSLLPTQKQEAFYNCWTRKEAYIKARGMGLSLPLNVFDVSLLPGEQAALLQSRENAQEVQRWSMQALEPAAGYAGALAVEGTDWRMHCWQWFH